jgi:hypothetical protein
MKRVTFALLLFVVAACVAIWRMPASVAMLALPDAIAQNMAPHVSVHAIDGTLWSGSAQLTLSAVPPTLRVAWQCSPGLSPFGLNCDVSDAIVGNVRVAALENAVLLSQMKIAQPIRLSVNGLRAFDSDVLSLTVGDARLSRQSLSINANAVSVGSTSRLRGNAAPIAIGEISMDCAPIDKTDRSAASQCTLRNRASDQRIDGQIELRPNRVSGSITTGSPAQTFTF